MSPFDAAGCSQIRSPWWLGPWSWRGRWRPAVLWLCRAPRWTSSTHATTVLLRAFSTWWVCLTFTAQSVCLHVYTVRALWCNCYWFISSSWFSFSFFLSLSLPPLRPHGIWACCRHRMSWSPLRQPWKRRVPKKWLSQSSKAPKACGKGAQYVCRLGHWKVYRYE